MNRMDELLERAFQLAHFIHKDEAVAKRIALAAAEKLEAVMAAHDKRRYYQPSRKSRNKVSLGELATLQLLVYAESECYERQREQAGQSFDGGLNQETMIVHFVKHLVRVTVLHRSLYVTLGISRLLHNYTTADTVELYSIVLQSPDDVPDDDFFRACKAKLMKGLKARFGPMLGVAHGPRGEERFVTHDNPSQFVALVHECLRQFTPWGTRCVIPENFDARSTELPDLRFSGGDPDEEHAIEANRYHATLDPTCFDRLVAGLKGEAPDSKLAIPVFQLSESDSGDGNTSPRDGKSPSGLSEEDRRLMNQHLETQSGRRKASTAGPLRGMLRVLVDGQERAQLQAERKSQITFEIGDSSELIEVWAKDDEGEFLLAAHLLEYEILGDALKSQQAEFAPESGQRLVFNIAPSNTGGRVELLYEPPAASALAQIKAWFWPAAGGWTWLKPVVTYALLLLAAGLLINRLARKSGSEEIVVVVPSPSPTITVTPTPVVQPSSLPSPSLLPADRVLAIDLRSRNSSGLENLTRSEREDNAVKSLLAAKKLYIEAKGSSMALQFGESLKQRLQSNVKFDFVDKPNKDDIALKLTVEPAGQRLTVIARIVNANGEVFWPLTSGMRARQYTGAQEKILDQLSRDLLSDIRQLEQKQK